MVNYKVIIHVKEINNTFESYCSKEVDRRVILKQIRVYPYSIKSMVRGGNNVAAMLDFNSRLKTPVVYSI